MPEDENQLPTALTTDADDEIEESAFEPADTVTFEDLGLGAEALALIRAAGYLAPTPIQEKAIPVILDHYDVIGSAQTGTGKTATFALPIIEDLAGRGGTLAVVLCPTREIAQQTFDTFEVFGKPRGVNSVVLIGGVDMKPQLEALKTYPQVVIATPGRLVDHMERGTVWLEYIEILCLDEADRMLDMGFLPQIQRILKECPTNRQTLLFSATMPPAIEKLTKTIMFEPVRISVGKPLAAATSVDHCLWICDPRKKMTELRNILRDEPGTVIVFSRSKKGVVEIWQALHSAGFYDATTLHSDRTQDQRMEALSDFKNGKYRVLIATDVAARGIDVANVAHVVNFDVPFVPEDYIHRIGRSGRASAKGKATTLATHQDRRLVHDIEKMLGGPIPVSRNTATGEVSDSRDSGRGGRRDSRGPRGGGGGGRHSRSGPPREAPRATGPAGASASAVVPNTSPRPPVSTGGEADVSRSERGPRQEGDADSGAPRRRRRGGRGRRKPGGSGGPGGEGGSSTPPAAQ